MEKYPAETACRSAVKGGPTSLRYRSEGRLCPSQDALQPSRLLLQGYSPPGGERVETPPALLRDQVVLLHFPYQFHLGEVIQSPVEHGRIEGHHAPTLLFGSSSNLGAMEGAAGQGQKDMVSDRLHDPPSCEEVEYLVISYNGMI